MIKALLDTNILIDFMVPDRPQSNEAALILEAAGTGRINAVASAASLKDVYYITRKSYPDALVRDYLAAFLDLLEIAPVDRAACICALASDEPDFEDGVVRAIAESAQVDFIVTRDAGAFANSSLRAIPPDLFAKILD